MKIHILIRFSCLLLLGFCFGWISRTITVPTPVRVTPIKIPALTRTADVGFPIVSITVSPTVDAMFAKLNEAANDVNAWRRNANLAVISRQLDYNQVLTLLERVLASGPDKRSDTVVALIARYAELNPKAAALFTVQQLPMLENDRVMRVVMEFWIEQDRVEAFMWSKDLPVTRWRELAMSAYMDRLSKHDPLLCLREYLSLPYNMQQSVVLSTIFRQLTRLDPTIAAKHAWELPPGRAQEEAIRQVVSEWSIKSPRAALGYLEKLTAGSTRRNAEMTAYKVWSSVEPQAAAINLQARGITKQQQSIVSVIATNWAKVDLQSALFWIEQIPSFCQSEAMQNILSVWTASNPIEAINYALNYPDFTRRESFLTVVIQNWGQSDSLAASLWVNGQPPGLLRSQAVQSLTDVWSGDPESCARFILDSQALEEAKSNESLFRAIDGWTENDPGKVIQWCDALPDFALRDAALTRVMKKLASADPTTATTQLKLISPEGKNAALNELMSGWVPTDPKAAAQWVESLSRENGRVEAAASLVRSWSREDPLAAVRWLENAKPDDVTDEAIGSILSSLAKVDPHVAVRWANRIADNSYRAVELSMLAHMWLTIDAAAAKMWISSEVNFTSDERIELLSK